MASIPIRETNGVAEVQKLDAIIIGAGFSGIANLYRLRKDGLNVHIFESASDFGGVWYWNRYPGARVDSETPFYQLDIPEVYQTWNFSSRFPDHKELRQYMAHADKVLNLRKDVSFDSKVNSAVWDDEKGEWHIKTENGKQASAPFLILATGLLHRTYTPPFPGADKYKGIIHHSGAWPEDTSVAGKRVCVVGAGATATQIVQELGKEAAHLTMLVRRPSYCIPMHQRAFTAEEQTAWRGYYSTLFKAGRNSIVGFPTTRNDQAVQDASPEARERFWEEIWASGGFQFLLRNYNNIPLDKEANKLVYDFWKKKVRERMTDPQKMDILAPDEMPYYFATKRCPLEHDFYEVCDRENVEIVDVREGKKAIERFTEKGLKLEGEDKEREFDVIVVATGFDSFTGSLTQMGLKSKTGDDITSVWESGVRTYLGMTISGFPNAFMVYTPQAPTALANGLTIIEAQRDFICDTIVALRKEGAKSIEATKEAEDKWKSSMNAINEITLYQYTPSWWTGANIPGKKSENMNYLGGIQNYEKECRDKMVGWEGFEVVAKA